MTAALEMALDATRCATRIVSTLVEEAANQKMLEGGPRILDDAVYLALLQADLDALFHAVYEAERFAREAYKTYEAEMQGEGKGDAAHEAAGGQQVQP